MARSMIHTYFCRKPGGLEDLREDRRKQEVRVDVLKVIQLTATQYQHFLTHISEDMPFLASDRERTYCDLNGVERCLLVTTDSIQGGILVNCEGYHYARYAAEVKDKSSLDLAEVPVERFAEQPKRSCRQQER